jgi:hypothetical protein
LRTENTTDLICSESAFVAGLKFIINSILAPR